MAKQKQFEGEEFIRPKDSFGGALLKNSHAKTQRPLDSKLPIHMTLKAKKSVMRLPKNFKLVNTTVARVCKKHGVTIYKYANVGNHLHLVIKIPGRRRWAAFIRELTGRVAQPIKDNGESFWALRPFTRIVRGWRKAFQIAKAYVELNLLEAEGFISRREIKTLKDLRALFDST
jgi:putative transposase